MTQQLGALVFARDLGFQHPLDSSQPPITPVPGNLTPSSALQEYSTSELYKNTYSQNSHIENKNKSILF